MNSTIIHLTNTAIQYDNRIIKEISCVSNFKESRVFGFGVYIHKRDNQAPRTFLIPEKVIIYQIKPFFCRFKYNFFLTKYLTLLEINIRCFLTCLKVKPNIIHVHDIPLLPVAYLVKKIMNSKLIYDAHELESQKSNQSKIDSNLIRFVEYLIWDDIDVIITVSDSIRKWYLTTFGYKKSEVILNSPPISKSHDIKNLSRNSDYFNLKFKIDINSTIFIYIGNFSKGRGINKLLDIFKDLYSYKAHIVFIGYGKLLNLIKNEALINPNIHYHPPINFEDLIGIIRNADYGICLIEPVSLSYQYSLPNKLFEYIFAGLNIIASDLPDIKEITNIHNLGYVTDLSNRSIKNTIINAIDNKKSFTHINKNLISWDHQAMKLRNIYKQLTAQC